MISAGSPGRPKYRNVLFTELIMSCRESMSVPSRSKISNLICFGSNLRLNSITNAPLHRQDRSCSHSVAIHHEWRDSSQVQVTTCREIGDKHGLRNRGRG